MNTSPWLSPALLIIVILAATGLLLLVRAWPRPQLSREEKSELAGTPMPTLKKHAWAGLLVSLTTTAIVTTLIAGRGVMTYWENDQFRLTVLLIFIAGLVIHSVLTGFSTLKPGSSEGLDERDRAILARAPRVQTIAMLLALAGWLVALGERFHEQGAIPMVYMYLLFGSIILVMMIAHSLGILLFYWIGTGHGES